MERFWRKVDRSGGPDACWPWTASRFATGYGAFGVRRKIEYAHRVAWTLTHGPIPAGLVVMHSCDNRACVNPAHLSVGTHADNSADMASKGRGTGVLSEAAVEEVKRRFADGGVTKADLGREFGISRVTVYDWVVGNTRTHTRKATQ